ncbi:MAG: M23 family metallopeptidase [Hyphomonadaceae bacterium]|nr:M23 family metallopeptidase [Hyphomonadaceae bacterium]
MVQTLVFGIFMAWAGLWAHDSSLTAVPAPNCAGVLNQGGLVVCDGPAGSQWEMGAERQTAGADGRVLFGLARNAASPTSLRMLTPTGLTTEFQLEIATRTDPFRVIEELDCDKVDARTPEQRDHAGRSWLIKQAAFDIFNIGPGVRQGFILPAEGPPSSPFGPERKYIGVSAVTGEPCEKVSVHRGYDIAAPVGTPIHAPAAGTIILADPDLYYEGGTIFLDHGGGLVSVFMHMSKLDTRVGAEVRQGMKLGEVGNTGRTTGPHLHWAVKWRNPDREDRSGDFYIDPALLLGLPAITTGESETQDTEVSATDP